MRPLKTLKKLYDEESHIIITEKGSPPRVMFYGEDFWVEDLPVGTRVICPRRPLEGVPNLKAAIRYAINHPEGMEPLLRVPAHAEHRFQAMPSGDSDSSRALIPVMPSSWHRGSKKLSQN